MEGIGEEGRKEKGKGEQKGEWKQGNGEGKWR